MCILCKFGGRIHPNNGLSVYKSCYYTSCTMEHINVPITNVLMELHKWYSTQLYVSFYIQSAPKVKSNIYMFFSTKPPIEHSTTCDSRINLNYMTCPLPFNLMIGSDKFTEKWCGDILFHITVFLRHGMKNITMCCQIMS